MPGVFDFSDGPMASFALVKQIAATRNCEIHLAKWRSRKDMLVVLKVYDSRVLTDSKMKAALKEAQIPVTLRSTGVPNVCKTFWAFTQATYFVIVQQYCEQGSLLQFFRSRGYAMTEQEACCMVAVPMLVTLWHIHQRDIVHADIKIDNIFITQNRAMLGDFGMTQTVRGKIKCFMGTTEFMAPEIVALRRREQAPRGAGGDGRSGGGGSYGFDQTADIWALGVVLYECLCGHRPWHSTEEEDVMADIEAVRLRRFPQQVSQLAKDLIMQMLTPSPEARPSATVLLSHEWVLRYVGPVIKRIQRSQQHVLHDITMMLGDASIAKSLQQSVSSIIDFSAIEDDGTGAEAAGRPVIGTDLPPAAIPPPAAMPTLLQALALSTRPPDMNGGDASGSGGAHPHPPTFLPPPGAVHTSNTTAYVNTVHSQAHQRHAMQGFSSPHQFAAHASCAARSGISISDVSNTLQPPGGGPPELHASPQRNVHAMQWQADAPPVAASPPPAPEEDITARPRFEQIPSRHATIEGDASAPPPQQQPRGDGTVPSPGRHTLGARGALKPHRRLPSSPGSRGPPGAMPRFSLDSMRGQARPGALLGGGHGTAHLMADASAVHARQEPVPEADPFQPLAANDGPAPPAPGGHHRALNSGTSSMARTESSGVSLGSNRYSMGLPAGGTDMTEFPHGGGLDPSRRSGSMRAPVRNSMSPVEEAADADDGSSGQGMGSSDSGNGRGGERGGRPAD